MIEREDATYTTYININVLWRITTFILSTIFYILVSIYYKDSVNKIIVLGMSLSCALSCWLYKNVCENELHFRIMFILEVVAYGIFILLSGGFNSPYLWYEVNCILLMLAVDKNIVVTFAAGIWCVSCAFAGREIKSSSYQDVNIVLGMVMLIFEFYIVRYYIAYIDKQREELENLNIKFEREKELSNYAFLMLAEISESFSLFAMTDPKKIMEKLSILIRKHMMYSQFIIIKFERDDVSEIIESYGIKQEACDNIVRRIKSWNRQHNVMKSEKGNEEFYLVEEGERYEVIPIGEIDYMSGALVRRASDKIRDEKDFYSHLIKTVFYNLDTYSQIERFVAVEEQNRIANEIHDTVIQKLFGITCSLAVLENKIYTIEKDDIKGSLDMLKHSVELTMAELRESIYGRRFKDNVNTFVHDIYKYMEEIERLNDVKIEINLDNESDYIATAQKIALYRISCEAVNDAVKHGKAKNVSIKLMLSSDMIDLLIEDDGIGFSKNDESFSEGNGLRNMRSMAALLKGYLGIVNGEKRGVRVKLSLPR